MNKSEAKKIAYDLAAYYLQSDLDNGCVHNSMITSTPEKDIGKIEKGIREIIRSLKQKGDRPHD